MDIDESTGLTKIVFAVIFIGVFLTIAAIKRFRTLKEQKLLPDDIPAELDLMYVKHNGFTLPIRGEEKIAWDLMSKPEKSIQVNKTRKALKNGSIIAVPHGDSYALAPREVAIKNRLDRVPVKGVEYKESWPPKMKVC